MANNRYIRPAQSGWDIVKEGHRRATVRTTTKKEAIARARELVRTEGGGEIRIMNSYGKITNADTVPARKSRARTGSRSRAR